MNRGTALLLAMAALLAHVLIVHTDGAGSIAPPYDSAHVAYTLARNLVQLGRLAWYVPAQGSLDPLVGGLESYASPLLVALAFVAERVYFPVTTLCQVSGIVAALLTVAITASFATNRFVGVVPPLLLVVNGGVAAAAASGTEIPLLMLFLTAAFVGLEHRWRVRLSLALALLVAARPEGVILAGLVMGLALLERAIPRRDGSPPTPLWVFAAPLIVATLLFGLRTRASSSLYGHMLGDLFTPDAGRVRAGSLYLLDFLATSLVPVLLAFPLVMAFAGKLSGAGLRALGLASAWCALVVLGGGGSQVFCTLLVPALPLICVAAQQGMIAALDLGVRLIEGVAWAALALVVTGSALVSKYPGNLGPLPTDGAHRAWMSASGAPEFGRDPLLGRLALQQEIETTVRLRALGSTLRSEISPDSSLLTPWPGSLGYLTRVRVVDLLQRVDGGSRSSLTWHYRPDVDVLGALQAQPDYVFLGFLTRGQVGRNALTTQLANMLAELDSNPRRATSEIESALAPYELLAIPLASDELRRTTRLNQPFYLLRLRRLGYAPRLTVTYADGRLGVDALIPLEDDEGEPHGQAQTARLRVSAIDVLGREWFVSPTGKLVRNPRVCARVGVYLYPSTRAIRLLDAELDTFHEGQRLVEVQATLLNPGTRGDHELAIIGEKAVLSLPQ